MPTSRKKSPTRPKPATAPKPAPAAPKPSAQQCLKCKNSVPDAKELLAKVCELAEICDLRKPVASENAVEARLAEERWNRDVVVRCGSQLRAVRAHVRGLCLQCHFSAQVPRRASVE